MEKPRGAFIVFEGLDRCGKSTQSDWLFKHLTEQGVECQQLRFPDRTIPSGIIISQYLKKKLDIEDFALHELFSINRWEWHAKIKDLLAKGVTLIVDRYAYSGVAFTSAKGYDLNKCKRPDRGLIAPDKVIFIDVAVEVLKTRPGFGDERYEKAAFQSQVREKFRQLEDASWSLIDGTQTREAMHAQIIAIAEQTIAQAVQQPSQRLWLSSPL